MKKESVKYRKTDPVLLALLAVAALAALLRPGNPTLIEIHDPTAVDPDPSLVIFNPFRDRGPEQCSESFLQGMRSGNCTEVMTLPAAKDKYVHDICQEEALYPLISWQLGSRRDSAGQSRIYYRVLRTVYKGFIGRVWVTVRKVDHQWKVTDYECWY